VAVVLLLCIVGGDLYLLYRNGWFHRAARWFARVAAGRKLAKLRAEAGRLSRDGKWSAAVPKYVELAKFEPSEANKLSDIGSRAYDQKQYEASVAAYSELLKLRPQDANALNNLAWLYLTAEDQAYQDARRAFPLAQKALELSQGKRPYILDTMAEAHYQLGQFKEAVQLQRQAVALKPRDLGSYQKRLEKFEKAATRDP